MTPLSGAEVARILSDEAAALAAANAIVIPENAQLTLNRQGYQAFQMVRGERCKGGWDKQRPADTQPAGLPGLPDGEGGGGGCQTQPNNRQGCQVVRGW